MLHLSYIILKYPPKGVGVLPSHKEYYKKPHAERAYRIPGGKAGIWLVAGLGIITCMVAITLGFFPPDSLEIMNIMTYEGILISGIVFSIIVPLILHQLKR